MASYREIVGLWTHVENGHSYVECLDGVIEVKPFDREKSAYFRHSYIRYLAFSDINNYTTDLLVRLPDILDINVCPAMSCRSSSYTATYLRKWYGLEVDTSKRRKAASIPDRSNEACFVGRLPRAADMCYMGLPPRALLKADIHVNKVKPHKRLIIWTRERVKLLARWYGFELS